MRNQPHPSSRILHETPWTRWVERPWGSEKWYGLEIDDYVQVIARTVGGEYPLVRQYRPAVSGETIELVAGLVDSEQGPLETAQMELKEEAGYIGGKWIHLDTRYADTGRLSNQVHTYVALDVELDPKFGQEEGVDPCLVSGETLDIWVDEGRLPSSIQAMGYLMAKNRGLFER